MMLMAIAQSVSEQALVPHAQILALEPAAFRKVTFACVTAGARFRSPYGRKPSSGSRTTSASSRISPSCLALIELEEGVEVISTIVVENRLGTAIDARVAAARRRGWSPLVQVSLEGP
jgi:hypothetical protein